MKLWREYVWETRLSPEQCAERLRHATERDEFWRGRSMDLPRTLNRSGELPFFTLRAPASPIDRNPFDPEFHGRFVAHGGGTRVIGQFGVSVPPIAILGVWLLGVIALGTFCALMFVASAMRGGGFGGFGTLLGAAFPVAGVAMLAWWWRSAAPQRRRLEQFLTVTFEAELLSGTGENRDEVSGEAQSPAAPPQRGSE
jgi:hypothetical protein